MPRQVKTQFNLFEVNTKTSLSVRIKDYSENGKDGYNSHWEYEVLVKDKKYSVFSDLYYSVWNEEDQCETDEKFHSYWPISIVPRPPKDISDLIRAAIMFVYYEDSHCCNAQEVSDWFEDRELTGKFDFESENPDFSVEEN